MLEQYGGHPAAAGVTLQKEKYEDFYAMMQQEASNMYESVSYTHLDVYKRQL